MSDTLERLRKMAPARVRDSGEFAYVRLDLLSAAADELEELQSLLDTLESLIRAMHKADDDYGCGYYNDSSWRNPYLRLRELVVENPVTIATDRTNERQTCRHCGNPVPCACW